MAQGAYLVSKREPVDDVARRGSTWVGWWTETRDGLQPIGFNPLPQLIPCDRQHVVAVTRDTAGDTDEITNWHELSALFDFFLLPGRCPCE